MRRREGRCFAGLEARASRDFGRPLQTLARATPSADAVLARDRPRFAWARLMRKAARA